MSDPRDNSFHKSPIQFVGKHWLGAGVDPYEGRWIKPPPDFHETFEHFVTYDQNGLLAIGWDPKQPDQYWPNFIPLRSISAITLSCKYALVVERYDMPSAEVGMYGCHPAHLLHAIQSKPLDYSGFGHLRKAVKNRLEQAARGEVPRRG